jgi:transcriptional regulator with XRE-family HTH domain
MTLQQLFIANLKKVRKERGLSQMTLSEKCDSNSNYIGQIEMGLRIKKKKKIEKIASALGIPSYALFACETVEKGEGKKVKTKDYLQKMPTSMKKEIVAQMTVRLKKDAEFFFDPQNY